MLTELCDSIRHPILLARALIGVQVIMFLL